MGILFKMPIVLLYAVKLFNINLQEYPKCFKI